MKNTGKGNLFVIFGEPDITLLDGGEEGGPRQIRVKVNGVDVFRPQSGEVVSDSADGIACWFIDTSRPFDKPASGRIAVKAINPLGDEVMKVFKVE